MLYDRNKFITYILLIFFSVFSIVYTIILVDQYNFRVGVLVFENFKDNVFDKIIRSPLTKFHLILMSFSFSRLYLAIQRQNQLPKENQSGFIRLVYNRNSYLFSGILWIVFLVTFVYYLLMGRNPLVNAYEWSKFQNAMFFGFAKFIIFFDLFLVMFIIFTKNAPNLTTLFSHRYFTALSKLFGGVYLIYPTVIFFLY